MKDTVKIYPVAYEEILKDTNNIGFDQLSDPLLGSFLSTLSATKVSGDFLELGTGSGISTSWILHGMDSCSSLTTVDSNEGLVAIAKKHLGKDDRVKFIIGEGGELITNTEPNSIDFIFADAWAGKY
ncbi:MAG: O-methyltransferase, partial [Arenicellales bacterium]